MRFSKWHWCCCSCHCQHRAAHFSPQHCLVDTISSLPNSDGGVILVSKVHELPIKFHDILDNGVSKLLGSSAHILAPVFHSASRQHCEVWASQFPFLQSLKDMVPPSEVCCYGCINLFLVRLSNSPPQACLSLFPLREVAKQGHRLGFISLCKRGLC